MKEREFSRTVPDGGLEERPVHFESVLSGDTGCVDLLLGMIKDAFFVSEIGIRPTYPGKFIRVNDSACKLLGYSREELLDKTASEIMDKQYIEVLMSDMGRDLGKEVPSSRSFLVRKNGSPVPVEITAKSYLHKDKRYLFYFARDISTQEKVGRLLVESEQKYKRLVNNLFEVIYSLKPDGTISFISDGVRDIFGFSPSEMIGRNFALFIVPQDIDKLTASFRARLIDDSEKEQFQDIRVYNKNGDIRHIHISSKTYMENGRMAGVIGAITDITESMNMQRALNDSYSKLEQSMEDTITAVSRLIEIRDPYTAGHQKRVFELSLAIAEKLGLSTQQKKGLNIASLVHDIGKVSVPSEILSKPGKLSRTEFSIIKGHPETGYSILKDIDFSWPVADIIRQHHERLDGSGYPASLKGDEILLEARIIAVADTVEAMSSHRPYRPALGIDQALEVIQAGGGSLFDPCVVDVCVSLFSDGIFAWSENKEGEDPK